MEYELLITTVSFSKLIKSQCGSTHKSLPMHRSALVTVSKTWLDITHGRIVCNVTLRLGRDVPIDFWASCKSSQEPYQPTLSLIGGHVILVRIWASCPIPIYTAISWNYSVGKGPGGHVSKKNGEHLLRKLPRQL